jgi:hypothetical protein
VSAMWLNPRNSNGAELVVMCFDPFVFPEPCVPHRLMRSLYLDTAIVYRLLTRTVSTASETIFLDTSLSNLPGSPPVYPSFHRRIAGALSTRAPQAWIEHIAQRVADEVERQDD